LQDFICNSATALSILVIIASFQ